MVVVFPASIWAMMPILRVLSKGTILGIALYREKKEADQPPPFLRIFFLNLPSIMSKGAIRLRHTMSVFFFLYCGASIISRVQQFTRQLFFHGLFATIARRLDQPAHAQRNTPLWPNLYRNLIGGAAYATRSNFDRWPRILNSFLKNADGIFLGLCRNNV